MSSDSADTKDTKDTKDAEEQPKGWPHQPIQDLDPAERDALLASGGPVGEMARVAQAQYETAQKRLEEPHSGSDATGPTSGVGMQELPPGPPSGTIPPPGDVATPQSATKTAPKPTSTTSKSS